MAWMPLAGAEGYFESTAQMLRIACISYWSNTVQSREEHQDWMR
jgi:hypothetical protein